MDTIETGTLVRDVRGRHVGHVAARNSCCIQIPGVNYAPTYAALLGAGQFGIELICDGDQLERYACPIHSAVRASSSP